MNSINIIPEIETIELNANLNPQELVDLLLSNPNWDFCLFHDENKNGDPQEFAKNDVADICYTIGCWAGINIGKNPKFTVTFHNSVTNPYIISTLIHN